MEAPLKSLNDSSHWTFHLPSVLRVPHVVSDEFLDSLLPLFLQKRLISHDLQLVHQSVNVLDENVISSDKDLLLLLIGLVFVGSGSSRVACRLGVSLGL